MIALRRLILRVCASLRWLPPTVTRLTLGWVFIESGWGKLHNLPKVIDFFRSLGIPAPEIQAPFAASMELLCGVLILLGLCTRLASLPLIVIMVVAIVTARRSELNGISDLFGFIEFLYIAMALWLGAFGAGPLSLDALFAKRMDAGERAEPLRAGAR
ncbi:MAG TPA: DoxX family protein [Thermoanaerobaculia bacterium]|jgi:putative oxidoreductase